MNTIAVFVNDAPHALRLLQPMVVGAPGADTRWLLVACAPRLTRRIGKFASHASREQWRAKWCERLFGQLKPLFRAQPAEQLQTLVAQGPLLQLVEQLRREHGNGLQLLDARRPRLGAADEPVAPVPPGGAGQRWAVPLAVSSGVSMVLALAD